MRVLFNRNFAEEDRLQRALNVRLSHCSEQMRQGLRALPGDQPNLAIGCYSKTGPATKKFEFW